MQRSRNCLVLRTSALHTKKIIQQSTHKIMMKEPMSSPYQKRKYRQIMRLILDLVLGLGQGLVLCLDLGWGLG